MCHFAVNSSVGSSCREVTLQLLSDKPQRRDICRRQTAEYFPAMLVAAEPVKPKHDCFLAATKCFCPLHNLRIQLEIEHEET